MRLLKRNKVPFYCAYYEGRKELVDEYGNETGEYKLKYSTPVLYKGNISAAEGEAQIREFGSDISYDRVIKLDKNEKNNKIDEYSVLWIDHKPVLNADGSLSDTSPSYDYVVSTLAPSLNILSIAIKKVNNNTNGKSAD